MLVVPLISFQLVMVFNLDEMYLYTFMQTTELIQIKIIKMKNIVYISKNGSIHISKFARNPIKLKSLTFPFILHVMNSVSRKDK